MFVRSFLRVLVAAAVATAMGVEAKGDVVLLKENFLDDPVAAGRATIPQAGQANRFTHAPSDQALIAAYHTAQPTATMVWPLGLGRPLTQADRFTFSASFKILDDGSYHADDSGGIAQIAFGLINTTTTGTNRVGNPSQPTSDTYDMVTVDYFPTDNPFFESITITPTIFASQLPGSEDAFNGIAAPFDAESEITDTGEVGPLTLDTAYTIQMAYDGPSRTTTVTLEDDNGLVVINQEGASGATGGPDGDVHTIEHTVPAKKEFPDDSDEFFPLDFSVDAFGLLLWEDGFNKAFSPNDSLIANVAFSAVAVTLIPEPSAIMVLATAMLIDPLFRRRRLR